MQCIVVLLGYKIAICMQDAKTIDVCTHVRYHRKGLLMCDVHCSQVQVLGLSNFFEKNEVTVFPHV